jgi:putative transposase
VQYASGDYRANLREHRITCRISKRDDCWDNAVAESFFASLERELIQESDCHTHEEARRAIFDYIEVWYNRRREHLAQRYTKPAE